MNLATSPAPATDEQADMPLEDLQWIWERVYDVQQTADGYIAQYIGTNQATRPIRANKVRELHSLVKADLDRRTT